MAEVPKIIKPVYSARKALEIKKDKLTLYLFLLGLFFAFLLLGFFVSILSFGFTLKLISLLGGFFLLEDIFHSVKSKL